jgi:WD40 repeat protein
MTSNMRLGIYQTEKIGDNDRLYRGVYSVQIDERRIATGLKDNTIKIFDRETLGLTQTMAGHTGSVLCIQMADDFIISGSSDGTARAWDAHTGECLHLFPQTVHRDSILHLAFRGKILITVSKDAAMGVWDISALYRPTRCKPLNIPLRRKVLNAHRSAINGLDFDREFIISASGDRKLKVWHCTDNLLEDINTLTDEDTLAKAEPAKDLIYHCTMSGHSRGIDCVQLLKDNEDAANSISSTNMAASGGGDLTIRIWDVSSGLCLHILAEAHAELVRSLKFFRHGINKEDIFLASASYDGLTKLWDCNQLFKSTNETSFWDFRRLVNFPCIEDGNSEGDQIRLLWSGEKQNSRVLRVMMDEFSLVAGAQDGSVVIYNFFPEQKDNATIEDSAL